jgi:hypothetical protein
MNGDASTCGQAMIILFGKHTATSGVPNKAASVARSTCLNLPVGSKVVNENENRPSSLSLARHDFK